MEERRLFSYEQANSLVPWLERTFQRLKVQVERLEEMRIKLEDIRRKQQRLNGTFTLHNEVNELQTDLDQLGTDLKEIVDAIIAEGIIVRDVSSGLVDFLHLRNGREVYLCWIAGEDRVAFWHETDRGFEHRQPL